MCVVSNCLALAFYDYSYLTAEVDTTHAYHNSEVSGAMITIDKLNIGFTIVYLVESILKSIFKGFIMHRKSYIRGHGSWVLIDLTVIVSGYDFDHLFLTPNI